MSRNLVKQMFTTVVQSDEKRVIDTNELVRRRLKENIGRQRPEGFVVGLEAPEAELHMAEDTEGLSGNVIKAREEEGQLLTQAKEEAEAILAEAKAKAMRICEDAKAQAELEKTRILAEARQQGYTEGISKARGEAQAEAEAARRECREKEKQLEDFYQQQIDGLEPQLVETITDIYQHIFHVELGSYREILAYLISGTLRKIEGGHDFLIHVSKEDYPHISMQKKQILAGAVSANCNVEVVEDMTLEKNQCLIETEGGIFDCGLGTQLAELKQKLTLLSWSREG